VADVVQPVSLGIKSLPLTQIFLSGYPDGVNLWYLKLRMFDNS